MLVLTAETDKIQVVLAGNVTANQLQCMSSWRDITTTAYTPGRTVINTNNTTDVDLVGSPAASTQRVIDFLSIYNNDTVASVVTVKFDANGTEYILMKASLLPLETLTYIEGQGWQIQSAGYKLTKTIVVQADAGANFVMTNATLAERFAGNSTRHLFMVDLAGYTQVRLETSKQVGSASAGTPQFRAKYYTSYNTTVGNFLAITAGTELYVGLAATGWFDSGWVDLVAGAKVNGICIGFTEIGGDGAIDPALGYTAISFR